MKNLSSLSKALLAGGAAVVLIVLDALYSLFISGEGLHLGLAFELGAMALGIPSMLWLKKAERFLSWTAKVCDEAAKGNMESRIIDIRESGEFGHMLHSINNVLDIIDAYLREAAASMQCVSQDKLFRKIIPTGLRGGFRNSANLINTAIDHMHDWALGTNGKWVTMGIPSDGQYGIPVDMVFGFPVTCEGGEYKLVEGLNIDAFSQECINKTFKELQDEQAGVLHLL